MSWIQSIKNYFWGNPVSKYDPQFPEKPGFSYMNKPNPAQFIAKIGNEFVREVLTNISDELQAWNTNAFWPMYFVATEWKKKYGVNLEDETIIKDILTNIYDELFPMSIKFGGISAPDNKLYSYYQAEIQTRCDFGASNKENYNLWSLNNEVLLNIYLGRIFTFLDKYSKFHPDFPFVILFSLRSESHPPIEFRKKIVERYINCPEMDNSVFGLNPFVKGNVLYVCGAKHFIGDYE